jgi:hypothetical protein
MQRFNLNHRRTPESPLEAREAVVLAISVPPRAT